MLLSTYKREGESLLVACGVSQKDSTLFCSTLFINHIPKESITLEDTQTKERFKVQLPESLRNKKGQFNNVTLEEKQ